MSKGAISYDALKSIRFPRYEDFNSAGKLAPSIKKVDWLKRELEIAQARTFGMKLSADQKGYEPDPLNADSFWARFKSIRNNEAFVSWEKDFKEAKPEMFFLGHPESRLPDIMGAAFGSTLCHRQVRGENENDTVFEARGGEANHYRVPVDAWKDATKGFRLLVMEHVGPYFHRPHLMGYDIHEHLRESLPDDGRALIWMVVPGRRGRLFGARAEFLRRCRSPDLSYHQFSDTVRTGLYGLIDSHVYLTRVLLDDQAGSSGVASGGVGSGRTFSPEALQQLWALQWDNEPELNALANTCMTEALSQEAQFCGTALYTERHFFWFLEKKKTQRTVVPSRTSRLRAIGALCACTDEVQRLLPDTEFWGCTVAHTVMDVRDDGEEEQEKSVLSEPIDLPQKINETLEWGYHWPFIFDQALKPDCESYSGGIGGCLIPSPWSASSPRTKVEGALMRSEGSVSFLAFPRFFQSRMVTPLPPPFGPAAASPTTDAPSGPNSSLAHIYRLRENTTDEFTRVRVLFPGVRYSSELSPAQNGLKFPEVLRRSLDASKQYSITLSELGAKDRLAIETHLETHAPHLKEFRGGQRSGSVWVFSVGYSHRRSRNHDPDFVSVPDLRAGFFGILFVPDRPGEPGMMEDYIELHKGRVAANIERILAKMAAEMVEEDAWQERWTKIRANLLIDDVRRRTIRLRAIQREAIDQVNQMGISLDAPSMVMFDARYIAVELFRHGVIEISPTLTLVSRHKEYDSKDSRAVLAYFTLRFLGLDENLKESQNEILLLDAAWAAFPAAFGIGWEEMAMGIKGLGVPPPARRFPPELLSLLGVNPETCDPTEVATELFRGQVKPESDQRNWLSSSVAVIDPASPQGEVISLRAKHAVDRLKKCFFTAFKINHHWDPEVFVFAVSSIANPKVTRETQDDTVWNLGRELPWAHGEWLESLVTVARVFLRSRSADDDLQRPSGVAELKVSAQRYLIELTKSGTDKDESDDDGDPFEATVNKSFHAALQAFEQGLAISLDVRLGLPTFGDFANGFRLLGATFRFVPQEDLIATHPPKMKWIRSEVTQGAPGWVDGKRTFSMRLWRPSERAITFTFTMHRDGQRIEFALAEGSQPVPGVPAEKPRQQEVASTAVRAPHPSPPRERCAAKA